MIAIGMSAAAAVVVMGTWGKYLSTIVKGTVPARPVGSVILQLLGICLAVAALVWSFRDGGSPGAAVIAPGALALMMGSFFLWLLSQRKTPVGDLKVAVGDKLLSFESTTSYGALFNTDSLAGNRTLLKFFRGGW